MSQERAAQSSSRAKYVALALIATVMCFNYIDRYLLSILLEDIKREIPMSDLQIGLLAGTAFALFYSGLAIPVARLADRFDRVKVFTGALVVWSLGTALCGATFKFWQLVIARVGVGSGEAGALPPAHSMVADYFPPARRASAMAVLGLASAMGGALAPLIGGFLTVKVGWRLTFVIVGLPGLLLALLVRAVLREPRRGAADGVEANDTPLPSVGEVIRRLYSRRAFRYLILTLALAATADYGLQLWMAPLFLRKLHLPANEIGALLFWHFGAPGFLGVLVGGALTDKLYAIDKRWATWVPALATLISAVLLFVMATQTDGYRALDFLIIPAFVSGFYVGPCYALIQGLAGVRSRAVAASIVVFAVNLVGAGGGPLVIGALSQAMTGRYGAAALQHAFLVLPPLYGLAGVGFFLVSRSLRQDLIAAAAEV